MKTISMQNNNDLFALIKKENANYITTPNTPYSKIDAAMPFGIIGLKIEI